jgi:hypothetical protein
VPVRTEAMPIYTELQEAWRWRAHKEVPRSAAGAGSRHDLGPCAARGRKDRGRRGRRWQARAGRDLTLKTTITTQHCQYISFTPPDPVSLDFPFTPSLVIPFALVSSAELASDAMSPCSTRNATSIPAHAATLTSPFPSTGSTPGGPLPNLLSPLLIN